MVEQVVKMWSKCGQNSIKKLAKAILAQERNGEFPDTRLEEAECVGG